MTQDTRFPWLKDRTIFLTRAGSHAYGTNIDTSDIDIRGLAIPPTSYFFGLNRFDQYVAVESDCVIYDLQKFFRLATQCNPNCIELLFTDPADHLLVSDIGAKLLASRDLFLSQRAYSSFAGYASEQLQKLRLGRDRKETTCKARTERVEKFGYDTKDAMHLVRLLRMGVEIMVGDGVIVKRPDAEELVSIRNGAWTLEQVYEYAAEQQAHAAEIKVLAEKKGKLPREPDSLKINQLCVDLIQESFAHKVREPIMATGPFATYEFTYGIGQLVVKKLTRDDDVVVGKEKE
jgi:predicted nucleotidyltransferase